MQPGAFPSAIRTAPRPRSASGSSPKASSLVRAAGFRSRAMAGRRNRSAENSEVAEQPPEQQENEHGRKTTATHLLGSIPRREAAQKLAHFSFLPGDFAQPNAETVPERGAIGGTNLRALSARAERGIC